MENSEWLLLLLLGVFAWYVGWVTATVLSLIYSSRWYNNWMHKRRFKKSKYALSEKDVVIKGNKEAYENLTVEMLDEFIKELDVRKFKFATGKQGVLDFERAFLVTILNKEELEYHLSELEKELREGIYHYDGMQFTYQGKLTRK